MWFCPKMGYGYTLVYPGIPRMAISVVKTMLIQEGGGYWRLLGLSNTVQWLSARRCAESCSILDGCVEPSGCAEKPCSSWLKSQRSGLRGLQLGSWRWFGIGGFLKCGYPKPWVFQLINNFGWFWALFKKPPKSFKAESLWLDAVCSSQNFSGSDQAMCDEHVKITVPWYSNIFK